MAMKQKINPLTGNFDMVSDGDSGTIKQKFNPLTGNFDMVGEGEVKMKLNPLTSNFDMVSEGGGGGGLPDAYQEVEYIESNVENGYGQVIDTGIYSGETISAEIKFKYNSDHFGDDRGIFGTYWTSNALLLTHYFQNIRWHNYGNWADYGDDGNIRIIKVTPEEIIIDGNTYQQESYGQSEEEEDHTICLFTTHRWSYEGGGYMLERCGAYKLYYFKIWDGETLVRDMIPCYRKSDNVAGMYDLVEGVFYTNQGTGDFIIPGQRQPGENTIAYRPLTENLNDVSGNQRNLSAFQNYYSFTTNQQGKACCELNPQDSNNGYFITGRSSSDLFDFENNDYTFVCSLCDASSTVYGARSSASIFSLGPQFKGPNISASESIGSSTGGREFADSISHTGPDVAYDFTQPDFKTIISVWNHTTQTFSFYVNGVLNAEDEKTGSFYNFDTFYLCYDQYDMFDAARRYHGKIRDVIVENKARTAQEIADYCSQN